MIQFKKFYELFKTVWEEYKYLGKYNNSFSNFYNCDNLFLIKRLTHFENTVNIFCVTYESYMRINYDIKVPKRHVTVIKSIDKNIFNNVFKFYLYDYNYHLYLCKNCEMKYESYIKYNLDILLLLLNQYKILAGLIYFINRKLVYPK